MSLRLPASLVAPLADNPIIEFVASDPPMSMAMDIARGASDAPPVTVPESGLSGQGVTVAMIDTGVAQHPDIQTMIASVDFTDTVTNPPILNGLPNPALVTSPDLSVDPMGHGTHVAAILVGNGSRSAGRLAGIAPQAQLVSVRVLDGTGQGQASDVLAGLQWVLAHKDALGIRVLNLSLGHPVAESINTDPLVQAVDALWDAGVVVVCAAGNNGRNGYMTINSPCNSRKVITVGATNDQKTVDISDDTMTTYSSRGPTAIDRVAKPDLVAPGNRIVSARAAGSYLDTLFPDRRVAADPTQPLVLDYFEMSGTSMSTPMVAGTAALMLQQDPTLNPATVKARLMLSARKPALGDVFSTGAGYLDILAALRTTGTVTDARSPKGTPDPVTGQIAFENTGVLWGNDAFSLMALWGNGVVWTDPTQYNQPIVWTAGEIWPTGGLLPTTEMWPTGEDWPQTENWPDQPAVSNRPPVFNLALDPNPALLGVIEPLAI
ncbi:MAG TPA: S8 family peptidase, partial [Acidimicrobiales bacterium]